MKAHLLILLFFASACKNQTTDSSESSSTVYEKYFPISAKDTLFDYGIFSVNVPSSWKKPNDDTLELNNCKCGVSVGRIQIGSNEFINYTYGQGVQNIFDTAYSSFRPKTFQFPEQKKYQVWQDLKGKYKIQYFRPAADARGYTGLFIDSLGKSKKVSFLMRAENLDSAILVSVIKAVNSINPNFKDEW